MTNRSLPFVLTVLGALVLASSLTLAGCDIFGIKNPGTIQDEDLNTPEAMDAIVTGMSADLTLELDQIGFIGARLSDEMAATGSYFLTGQARRGVIEAQDTDTYWEGMQRARFAAEDGIERMRRVLGEDFGDRKELGARALLFAGLSNRVFGENFRRVVFDGGEAQPRTAAFERAIPYFEEAIQKAEEAGASDIETAARGGLAQVHMNLGNWSEATDYASEVPTDFVYNGLFSSNSSREYNEIYDETHERYEMSALGTLIEQVPNDPRVPFTDCRGNAGDDGACTAENGAGGNNPHLRQEKYQSYGADMPLVKGTEMRLIEAEAELNQDSPDLTAFEDKINEVRSHHGLGDAPSPTGVGSLNFPPTQDDDAWSILDRERQLTLWLEARRLNDLARWDHPFLDGNGIVYTGNVVEKRVSVLPLAESECNNNDQVECEQVYTR